MNACKRYERQVKRLFAGEASPGEMQSILNHAEECSSCRDLIELHRQLAGSSIEIDSLAVKDLERVRASVLNSVLDRKLATLRSSIGFWSSFRDFMARPVTVLGLASAALMLGVWLGYRWNRPAADFSAEVIKELRFSDVKNSPHVYSNVLLKNIDAGRVALSFDVTRHVDLTTTQDDPLVKAMLVQSLLNPSPVGPRLKAIAYASTVMGPEVKEALLVAMLNDQSIAVRLKAQNLLSSYKNDKDVQAAFLQVLRGDGSVQMRLGAIDYLVEDNLNPNTWKDIIRELRSKDDTAVLAKAVGYTQ